MNKLYEKYLMVDKASRKEALDKVVKTVKTAKNEKQLRMAAKMVWNFDKLYGQSFMNDLKELFGGGSGNSLMGLNSQENKFMKMIHNKADQLRHEKSVNQED